MDHNTKEIRQLFVHLLLFLLVAVVLRIWNMVMFGGFPWSQFIIIPWIAILALHLLLFFMSTGIIGTEYENVPVRQLVSDLLQMIKARNLRFKNNLKKPANPSDSVNN